MLKRIEIKDIRENDKPRFVKTPMNLDYYYGNSPSAQANAKLLSDGDIDIYYSYETIIAVKIKNKLYIAKNIWGNTTGKHLNAISRDKSIRIDVKELKEIIDKIKLVIS